MKLLIKDITVIPMTSEERYFSSDVYIEDGIIKKIEKDIKEPSDKTIDGKDKVLLPAFINTHTHLSMTLMRNYKDDEKDLQSWLSEVWKAEDQIRDGELYYPSLLGLAEEFKSGTLTFSDMYFFPWDTAKAVKESKGRGVLGLTLFGDENETDKRINESLPRLEESIDSYDRLTISIAPHSIYTTNEKTLIKARDIAIKKNMVLHTHISETEKEVRDSISQYSMTPLEYIDSLGLLDAKCTLAHGVHLRDEELEIISKKNASVLHCPTSNAKLSSGYADVAKYIDRGINVSLGTDGASSNNNLSVIKEINASALLNRLYAPKTRSLKPYEILKMATINGAKALGLDSKIGTVEVGKEADLLILDMKKTNTTPVNNIFSSIVFSLSNENVDTLISKGDIVLENGKLLTIDEEEAIEGTKEIWNKIQERMK